MDLKALMQKLETIDKKQNLMEAITMKDVQAAVGQEKDEQKRAAILNDLAWKEKLPGLYDPVSGYFVAKQSAPVPGEGMYSISATARKSDTEALAKLGLVPGSAKTSALGGLVGTGSISNTADQNAKASQDVKNQSAKVQGAQSSDAFYAPKIARLKELIAKISGTTESFSFNSAIARSLVESFNYTLSEKVTLGTGPAVTNPATGVTAGKFQKEVAEINKIIGELGDIDQLPPDVAQVVQSAQGAVSKLSAAPAAAPAAAGGASSAAAPAAAPAAGAKPAAGGAGSTTTGFDDGSKMTSTPGGAAATDSEGNPYIPGSNPNLPKNQTKTQGMDDGSKLTTGPGGVAATNDDGTPYVPGSNPNLPKNKPAAAAAPGAATGVNAQGQNVTMPDGTNPETGEKTTTAAGAPAASGAQAAGGAKPAAGGVDPKLQKIQDSLIKLGINVGKTGADGKMGPATVAGIKAFEKMAGKPETGKVTPELEQLLAQGAQIKSQSDLVASIGAMEKILTKYKVESVTSLSDLDIMTEAEIRSYVMRNINHLYESEKMEFMKLMLTEAPVPAVAGGGAVVPAKPAGNPNVIDVPFRDVTPKPGVGSRIADFGKKVFNKLGGGKALAVGGGLLGAAAAFLGIKKLMADPSIQMDPADKAEFEKHMAVIDKYAKDAEAANALPKDVQQRLSAVAQRLQKVAGKVQAKPGAPAAPGAAPTAPAAAPAAAPKAAPAAAPVRDF